MSGGGSKVARGRMSSKLRSEVSPQQLQQLEETLQSQERSAEEMLTQRTAVEQKVKELKKEVARLEEELKTGQKELDVLRVQEKALQERIKDLQVQQADSQQMDPAHLAKLEKQVKQFSKEHEKEAEAASEVQLEVQSLHHQIMEVSGGRMQQQQAQVDAVSKEMDKTRDAMTKANVAIKTAGRNTKKSQDKVNSLEKEVEETEKRISEVQETLTALEEEAKEVIDHQQGLRDKLKEHEELLRQLKEDLESVEGEEAELQGRLVDLRHELEKYSSKLKENQAKIKHFNNEIKKLDLGEEGGVTMEEAELEAVDKQAVEYEITMLEERLKQMTPNMAAIDEYKRKEELHQARLKELDVMTGERDAARIEFESMRKQRLDQFMAGFSVITNKLKEMYQMITLGGDAELELVDSLDPFSEGIVFSVRPPKKSWKNISNLSGGEKTLSSLALVFALHHYKPSPLYVMDEIDAALDFKNVSIVAHYIKERTKNAQFIIISLRNNMFELADRLVGIYKTDNTTKSVTIDPYKMAQAQPTAA